MVGKRSCAPTRPRTSPSAVTCASIPSTSPTSRARRARRGGRPRSGSASATGAAVANAHARVMWGMGIRPHDVVLIGSPLSQYWGSWGAYIGAERLGAAVFPFGAGFAGQSLRTRAVDASDGRDGVLRHPLLRAATSPRWPSSTTSIPGPGAAQDVLLGRARGQRARRSGSASSTRSTPRSTTRAAWPRSRRGCISAPAGTSRAYSLAGPRLHRGLRSGDHAASPLRRRGHARLHDLGAHRRSR